jgi:hypothetical protein
MARALSSFALAAVGGAACLAGGAAAQQGGQLGPQDYLDIRQLIDTYPHLLDHCSNSGYDYADLFTADRTFGVSPPGYHLNINPVIEAAPEGARAVSTRLTITSKTGERGDAICYCSPGSAPFSGAPVFAEPMNSLEPSARIRSRPFARFAPFFAR